MKMNDTFLRTLVQNGYAVLLKDDLKNDKQNRKTKHKRVEH
jgi:hypothetical protein